MRAIFRLTLVLRLSALCALAQPQYTFTPIEVPGASLTRANGINNRGQLVGAFADGGRTGGFLATPRGQGR